MIATLDHAAETLGVARLRETLAKLSRDGYTIVDGEYEPDLLAIASPVRGWHDQVIVAVNIAGPAGA